MVLAGLAGGRVYELAQRGLRWIGTLRDAESGLLHTV